LCTELGPAQCYSHRPGVGFRPHNACPNRGRRRRRCFLTAAHRSWVPTAPQFSVPMCAALALAYNLRVLLFMLPIAAPLSTEHRCADRLLQTSLETAFTAMTSTQAHCCSPTSEPAPSATPPACRRWCPSARTCCRGRPIPGELLYPPLLSSIHRGHIILFPPHPSSLHRSTGRSSEPPPCLCSACPDTLHR
jgi:hypothetical protein